jgi:hypothetical protein
MTTIVLDSLSHYAHQDVEHTKRYLSARRGPSYKLYVTRKIPVEVMERAEKLVRGEYQRRLLRGQEPWENIANKSIGSGYTKSRDGFRKRLAEIGLFPIVTTKTGRRVLRGVRVLMCRVPTPLVEQLAQLGEAGDDDAPEVVIVDDLSAAERAELGF